MTSKLVRMEPSHEDILKRYGKTPSDGVLAMEQQIKMLTEQNRELKETVDKLLTPPVNKVLQPVTPSVNKPLTNDVNTGFSRGSGRPSPVEPPHITAQKEAASKLLRNIPVKPDEYVEPVDKSGRPL